MELKSKENLQKEAIAYLNKTSNHLFVINNNVFYKIITFENEGKNYYAIIMVNKGNITVNVNEVISDNNFKYYGNNSVDVLKKSLFPEYYKSKSIPYFKRFRDLIDTIKPVITTNNSKNSELMKNMVDKVHDLEVIK